MEWLQPLIIFSNQWQNMLLTVGGFTIVLMICLYFLWDSILLATVIPCSLLCAVIITSVLWGYMPLSVIWLVPAILIPITLLILFKDYGFRTSAKSPVKPHYL